MSYSSFHRNAWIEKKKIIVCIDSEDTRDSDGRKKAPSNKDLT